ncbi:MAG TPA: nuclear transport factor 2 family protein [Acidobacteriota bacterium]|nr:nuclear transport factor 2 family protein [Acidobacteriota bacterium]
MKRLMLKVAAILVSFLLFGSLTAASAKSPTEKNKEVAVKFYNMIFVDHKVEEAFKLYSVPEYKQHNPMAASGAQAAIGFLGPFLKSNPQYMGKIIRVIAEGDLVAIHNHVTSGPNDRGRAVVDIFRVVNGKVVEHWDVIQDVPAKSANENTMF